MDSCGKLWKYGKRWTSGRTRNYPMSKTPTDRLRARLAKLAEKYREALDAFERLVADPNAAFAELEAADTNVKKLAAERARLMDDLRLAQFEEPHRFGPYRGRAGQRPIREAVLDIADELGVPVSPRLVSDYAVATFGMSIPPTRYGSLRRDEERAYKRDPRGRPAWVVPAINATGLTAIPRLIGSSAWEPERRLIAARTLRVNHLKVLLALIGKASDADERVKKPLTTMIGRFATWLPAGTKFDFEDVATKTRAELASIEPEDEKQRRAAAAELTKLPTIFQLWGRPGMLEGGEANRTRAIG
jgi:hypothetical protein